MLGLADASGLTELQLAFLAYYQLHGLLTAAAESTGIPQRLVKRWQDEPVFAEAMEEAGAVYCDVIRREIHRRAIDGWDAPVYQRGVHVGYERRYSDNLLQLLAKTRMPEFREKPTDVNVNNQVVVIPWGEKPLPSTAMTAADVRQVIEIPASNGKFPKLSKPSEAHEATL